MGVVLIGLLCYTKGMGRPALDLTNKTFGDLTALYRSSAYKEHPVLWCCLCACGNQRDFPTRRLQKGDALHCGCKTVENLRNVKIDYTIVGKVFSDLTVISYSHTQDSHAHWLCVCKCGEELIADGPDLRSGNIQRCKKCRPQAMSESRTKDMLGKICGDLVVLSKGTTRSSKNEFYWLCRCKCGVEYEVRGSHLRAGTIKRCRKCQGAMKKVENPISGYPTEFSLPLRSKIRRRDNKTCQYCKKVFGKGGLDVHHIDHDRTNNSGENLISLCNSCHYKMHHKADRGEWTTYWQQYQQSRLDLLTTS